MGQPNYESLIPSNSITGVLRSCGIKSHRAGKGFSIFLPPRCQVDLYELCLVDETRAKARLGLNALTPHLRGLVTYWRAPASHHPPTSSFLHSGSYLSESSLLRSRYISPPSALPPWKITRLSATSEHDYLLPTSYCHLQPYWVILGGTNEVPLFPFHPD